MSSQIVSSWGSSSSHSWKFDVFLSFRGEDTRKNFTDHLYNSLTRAGINVYRDDKNLEIGKSISVELPNAIEQSRFSIVVFSRNYAYSTWCLDELVKIVECAMTRGQTIIPIFYDVKPFVEREDKGNFQEALAKHEETFKNNIEKVEKWRSALMEVINLPGKELTDRCQSEIIEEIVKEISSRISSSSRLMMNVEKLLVGVSSCLEKLRMQAEIPTEKGRVRLPQLSPLFFFWPMPSFIKGKKVHELLSDVKVTSREFERCSCCVVK